MLAFAVQYQSAINNITGDKNANLRKYELDEAEWNIALQLHSMLKVHANPLSEIEFHPSLTGQIFKDTTLFFSRSTPCLATVIPAMDHIDETLTNNSLDLKFEPSIHAALRIAKKTLNRYYDVTDQSEVYRIAMGVFSLISFSH